MHACIGDIRLDFLCNLLLALSLFLACAPLALSSPRMRAFFLYFEEMDGGSQRICGVVLMLREITDGGKLGNQQAKGAERRVKGKILEKLGRRVYVNGGSIIK
jgi:hypothetical protein